MSDSTTTRRSFKFASWTKNETSSSIRPSKTIRKLFYQITEMKQIDGVTAGFSRHEQESVLKDKNLSEAGPEYDRLTESSMYGIQTDTLP